MTVWTGMDYPVFETGERLGNLKTRWPLTPIRCAGIVQARRDGADIAITGRCSILGEAVPRAAGLRVQLAYG